MDNYSQMIFDFEDGLHTIWQLTKKTDSTCRQLADRHYSRQTKGAINFCRPGHNFVLRTALGDALWVAWYSPYRDDGFEAIECTLFRNESDILSSELILLASIMTFQHFGKDKPRKIITYVKSTAVKSSNAGYCYLKAGYKKLAHKSSKGLLTFEITFQDVLQQVNEYVKSATWYEPLNILLHEIQENHKWMNHAFEEYDFEMALDYSLSAAAHFAKIINLLERGINQSFANARYFLLAYFQHVFASQINIENFYQTLYEWNEIEYCDEISDVLAQLEAQIACIERFVSSIDEPYFHQDFSLHLLNWITI